MSHMPHGSSPLPLTDSDEDHGCVCEALRCVKELIMAVDGKVNEQEKKQRLREVYRYMSPTGDHSIQFILYRVYSLT